MALWRVLDNNERAAVPHVQAPATKENNSIKKQELNAERKGRSPLNRLANRPFSRSSAVSLNLMLFSIGLFFILSAFRFPSTCAESPNHR